MSSGAWTTFRAIRIVVFALATLLCMASTVIFAVLLLREWELYNTTQHVITILSLTINAISAILLYLMIVVHSRLWLEAARVAFVLSCQLGSTITFAIFVPTIPCGNLGSEASCRLVESIVINLGWVQTGILLLYTFYLVAMSYVPPPPPPTNPEATLTGDKRSLSPTSSINSETYLINRDAEKRQSGGSVQSHGTFIQPLSANPSLYRGSQASIRSISVSSRHKHGVYRPVTPAVYNTKASGLYSGTRRYGDRDTPASPSPSTPRQPPAYQNLPNPFADLEPVNRQASSLSETSSIYSGRSGRSSTPMTPHPAVTFPYDIRDKRSLPRLDGAWRTDPGPGRPLTPIQLTVPPTPASLRPSYYSNLPPREFTATPGMQSVRSFSASMHNVPSRSIIPSPTMSTGSLGLPVTPRPGAMALPPPPFVATSSMKSEMKRY